MKAIIKRVVLRDDCSELPSWRCLNSLAGWIQLFEWLAKPRLLVPTYVLGFRLEATPREKTLIESNAMSWHPVLTLYQQYRENESGWFADPPVPLLTLPERNPVPFIDAMGSDFVPVVTEHVVYLAAIETLIHETAETWTRFFETMPDPI